MSRNPPQFPLNVVVLASLLSAGCSARRPLAASGPPFRLGAVYGRPVLFSPAIPESHANDSPANLRMNAPSAPASAPADCHAENGPFRVDLSASHPDVVEIKLPSANRWIEDIHSVWDPDGDAVKALYSVLHQLDQPQPAGCSADTVSMIRDFLLQSLPMEPNDSLFSYYGYRSSRSGLDLKPGMRLKVERAYLKSAASDEQRPPSENQEGVSSVYFLVESGSDGKLRFRRVSDARFNPASLRKKFQNTAREPELAALQPELQYRLVFYGLHVPTGQKLSASIIGGSNASKLDEFERELRLRPAEGCRHFAAGQSIACIDFTGWVTVTPQFTVALNGKPKFLDCGTPVRDVVPAGSLHSLRIQRKFVDSYRDVRFKPEDANVLGLVLVGGDRLSWSNPTP